MIKKIISLLILSTQCCFGEESIEFCGEVRVNMLKGWDKLLTWTLLPRIKPFYFTAPIVAFSYDVQDAILEQFINKYGYFSAGEPIVGIVTDKAQHISETNEALKSLTAIQDVTQQEFSRDEILAKVMAYRTLKKGMEVTMPSGSTYTVDAVINLWRGMPAFGLTPNDPADPPILLYRGTDMDLVSEKGWASILSDLDTTGPGHSTFLRARNEIHDWLVHARDRYQKARLIGYSLGGALVFYTMVYETDLISTTHHTVAYNPPGISKEVLAKWEESVEAHSIPLYTFVNQGDVVSQIGFFLTNVWEVSLESSMDVIQAHTALISAEPHFNVTQVDVAKENAARMENLRKR